MKIYEKTLKLFSLIFCHNLKTKPFLKQLHIIFMFIGKQKVPIQNFFKTFVNNTKIYALLKFKKCL
jgi:hypothetical protein